MAHPKGELIDRAKHLRLGKPTFQTKSTGPAHEPTFLCDVVIKGEVYGTGQGGNKRDAERRASEEALAYLDNLQAAEDQAAIAREAQAPKGTAQPANPLVEEGFEGPWPIFPEVLAASFAVANSRVDGRLKGLDAIAAVQELALKLYKSSLETLGEIVEIDEDAP